MHKLYSSLIPTVMVLSVIAFFGALSTIDLSTPAPPATRLYAGATGFGADMLANARAPDICLVTDMGDSTTAIGGNMTLRDCVERDSGFRIVVFTTSPGCVFQTGPAGEGAIEVNNDSLIVLGGTCAAGHISIRSLSHALLGAAATFNVRGASNVALVDVNGWDEECNGVGGDCTPEEQKQLRFAVEDGGYLLRAWYHGNSGDDVASLCNISFSANGCKNITIEKVGFGPVKRYSGGEGQCFPLANDGLDRVDSVTILQSGCFQAGHRSIKANCLTCEVINWITTGQGGRSFESTDTTFINISGSIWRAMYVLSSNSRSDFFRFRENVNSGGEVTLALADQMQYYYSTTNAADTLFESGSDSTAVWDLTGSAFVDHLFQAGSRCANGTSLLADGCTNGGTADTSDVFDRSPIHSGSTPAPIELTHTALWDTVVVDFQIGPHVLFACDGTVSSLNNLRPFTKTHLTRSRWGRHPTGNSWPTTMQDWAQGDPYPDTTSVGVSCSDTDNDGANDALEARLNGDGLTDDTDGDGYMNFAEVYMGLTDPLVENNHDGTEESSVTSTYEGVIKVHLVTPIIVDTIVTSRDSLTSDTVITWLPPFDSFDWQNTSGDWPCRKDNEALYVTIGVPTMGTLVRDSTLIDSIALAWAAEGCDTSRIKAINN